MCVRFELYNTPKIVKFLKGVKYTLDKPKDIRPGDSAPVIAMDKNGKLVFNSRNEDIINRKMFKQDFISHRLAIPATSYYEWDKEKTKYKLSTNDELMYFAGIYHYENNQFVFSILTKEADEKIKNIHERMPFILAEKDVKKYIDPRTNLDKLPGFDKETELIIKHAEEKLF